MWVLVGSITKISWSGTRSLGFKPCFHWVRMDLGYLLLIFIKGKLLKKSWMKDNEIGND